MTKLRLVPMRRDEAKDFVRRFHRHNAPPVSWFFGVGVVDEAGELVGVGMAGRPSARGLDDGRTVEITRIVSTGARNVCSMLYGALSRAAFALGYRKVVTYTLQLEPGTSLIASGFEHAADLEERAGWDTPSRRRAADPSPRGAKRRWEKTQ